MECTYNYGGFDLVGWWAFGYLDSLSRRKRNIMCCTKEEFAFGGWDSTCWGVSGISGSEIDI